jgi:hypothetical protein
MVSDERYFEQDFNMPLFYQPPREDATVEDSFGRRHLSHGCCQPDFRHDGKPSVPSTGEAVESVRERRVLESKRAAEFRIFSRRCVIISRPCLGAAQVLTNVAFSVFSWLFLALFPVLIVRDLRAEGNVMWPFYISSALSFL